MTTKLEGKHRKIVASLPSCNPNIFLRGIPNNIVLGKMERVLGVKLRGKDIGQAVAPPTAKK